MKLREFKNKYPLNLQFFAEESTEPGAEAEPGADVDPGKAGPKTFDELLKDKAYQSEFDKRISKALETAKGKWDTDSQQRIEDAKSEAEKIAKMNADQKAQYDREKQESDYNKRLSDLTTKELKLAAKEILTDKGLSHDLIEILNYSDAEKCNKSIEVIEKSFKSAVEKAVNEKLKGSTVPKMGAPSSTSSTMEQQIYDALKGK